MHRSLVVGVLLGAAALRPAPRRRVAPRPQSVATGDEQDEIMATICAAWETAPNTRDFDVTLEPRAPPANSLPAAPESQDSGPTTKSSPSPPLPSNPRQPKQHRLTRRQRGDNREWW